MIVGIGKYKGEEKTLLNELRGFMLNVWRVCTDIKVNSSHPILSLLS